MGKENILRDIIVGGKADVVEVNGKTIAKLFPFDETTLDRDELVKKFADLNGFELYIDKDSKTYYFRTKPK